MSSRNIWSRRLREAMEAAMCAPNSIIMADLSIQTIIKYATFALRLESMAQTNRRARIPRSLYVSLKLKNRFKLGLDNEILLGDFSQILNLHHLPGGRWIIGSLLDGEDYVVCCWDAHTTMDDYVLQPTTSFRYERAASEQGCYPELIPQHDGVSGKVNILCAYRVMNQQGADNEGDVDSGYVLFQHQEMCSHSFLLLIEHLLASLNTWWMF